MAPLVSVMLFKVVLTALMLTAPRCAPIAKNGIDNFMQRSRNNMNAFSTDNSIAKIEKKLYGKPLKISVAISEEDATKFRRKMEDENEQMLVKINKKKFDCGNVTINKITLEAGDIPSFFYEVTCPKFCINNNVGNLVFRQVELQKVYYEKMDSATKNYQYELRSRSLIVDCYLEEENDSELYNNNETPSGME